VEHVWDHTQYGDLANYIPDDVLDLEIESQLSLEDIRFNPTCCAPAFMGPSSNHDLLHSRCEDQ